MWCCEVVTLDNVRSEYDVVPCDRVSEDTPKEAGRRKRQLLAAVAEPPPKKKEEIPVLLLVGEKCH